MIGKSTLVPPPPTTLRNRNQFPLGSLVCETPISNEDFEVPKSEIMQTIQRWL